MEEVFAKEISARVMGEIRIKGNHLGSCHTCENFHSSTSVSKVKFIRDRNLLLHQSGEGIPEGKSQENSKLCLLSTTPLSKITANTQQEGEDKIFQKMRIIILSSLFLIKQSSHWRAKTGNSFDLSGKSQKLRRRAWHFLLA